MRRFSPWLRALLLSGCGLAAACSSNSYETAKKIVPPAKADEEPDAEYTGGFGEADVDYWLAEQAHDGSYYQKPGRGRRLFDPHSALTVYFDSALAEAYVETDPDWKTLNELLAQVDELVQEKERIALLAERTDVDDAAAVESLQQEVRAQRLAALTWRTAVKGIFEERTEVDFERLEDGDPALFAEDADPRPAKVFRNVSIWLRQEVARLSEEFDETLKAKDRANERYLVTVEASSQTSDGQNALHVQNYDRLDVGQVETVDRYGLKLTARERRELGSKMKGARVAADFIEDIDVAFEQMKAAFRGSLEDFLQKLERLHEDLLENPDDVLEGYTALIEKLEQLAVDDPAAAADARALIAAMEAVKARVDRVSSLVSEARALLDLFDPSNAGQLESVLLGDSGVYARAERLLEGVEQFLASLETADEDFETALRSATELVGTGLEQEAQAFGASVGAVLSSFEFVQFLKDTFLFNAESLDEVSELGLADADLIPHSLGDLPPATVDLKRQGVHPDDQVELAVRFWTKNADGTRGAVVYEDRYSGEAEWTGFHREITAALIFARATSSQVAGANDWKANVAAMANWMYRFRAPDDFFEGALNWLEPGVGIHVASLDQGPDSVEFGLGANFTIWGGMLIGGYGWNLSVSSNREYYFVGTDLLKILNFFQSGMEL